MIGNPHRRKRRKHARRSHRRARRYSNPAIGRSLAAFTSGPREMATTGFLQEAGSVAVGFVAPNLLLPMLPAQWRDSRWKVYASKVAVVSALAAGANAFVSKRVAKAVLLGGGVSLLLDAYADFVLPLLGGAGPSLRDGVGAYYGDPTGGGQEALGAYYGDPTGGMGDDQGGEEYGSPY